MSFVHADLARIGLIDPPSGPRDEAGHYEGVFTINGTRSLADIQDGTSDTILMAECDFGRIDVQRTHWPFLRDRRIDAYHDITKRMID